MIKIIKNGKIKWWEFECDKCGCVFQIDDDEVTTESWHFVTCPQCHHMVDKSIGVDVGEQEITNN